MLRATDGALVTASATFHVTPSVENSSTKSRKLRTGYDAVSFAVHHCQRLHARAGNAADFKSYVKTKGHCVIVAPHLVLTL